MLGKQPEYAKILRGTPPRTPPSYRPGPDTLIHHRQSASPRDRSRSRKSATTNQWHCGSAQPGSAHPTNTEHEAGSGKWTAWVIVTAVACIRMRMAASEAMRMRIERDETVRMCKA